MTTDPPRAAAAGEGTGPLGHPAVARVVTALRAGGSTAGPRQLDTGARTAVQAAASLGVEVGQIASSIVFGLPAAELSGNRSVDLRHARPLLVVTSGAHRVDEALVAADLGAPRLLRADAERVRAWAGFAIGGVAPVGWHPEPGTPAPTVLVDRDLADHDTIWAAAGHPQTVFPTTFDDLVRLTGGRPATVAPRGEAAS